MVGKAKKPAPPNESSVLLLQDCGQAPASKMMEILLIKNTTVYRKLNIAIIIVYINNLGQ